MQVIITWDMRLRGKMLQVLCTVPHAQSKRHARTYSTFVWGAGGGGCVEERNVAT